MPYVQIASNKNVANLKCTKIINAVRFYMTNFLYTEQSQVMGIHVPVNIVMEKVIANIGLVCSP
jgi:hypothetical protein